MSLTNLAVPRVRTNGAGMICRHPLIFWVLFRNAAGAEIYSDQPSPPFDGSVRRCEFTLGVLSFWRSRMCRREPSKEGDTSRRCGCLRDGRSVPLGSLQDSNSAVSALGAP